MDDRAFLKEVLLLLALSVERRAGRVGLYGEGVTLKLTYADMKTITRSKAVASSRAAAVIYQEAAYLLDRTPDRPVRLIGAGLTRMSGEEGRQLRFDDLFPDAAADIQAALDALRKHYGLDFAGNLEKIYHGETLYKTIEYMRRHRHESAADAR